MTGSKQNNDADHTKGLGEERVGAASPDANQGALPVLQSRRRADDVLAALDAAARKGKLPGLVCEPGKREFRVVDFGKPFESRLCGVIEEQGSEPGIGCRITFTLQMRMMMPIIFGVMLIVSVWPGILLTDSMLKMYFSWYTIPTWWWYLPLTVPFVPFAFRKAWRLSRASGEAEALEVIEGISEVV